MSVFEDQAHFMRSCDQSVTQYNPQQAALYLKLIDEEYNELLNAKFEAEAADAVIDMMVVLIGYGLSRGWPMHDLWDEVFRSNMSKLDPVTGRVIKREDGKVMKPSTYSPPDLVGVMASHRSA